MESPACSVELVVCGYIGVSINTSNHIIRISKWKKNWRDFSWNNNWKLFILGCKKNAVYTETEIYLVAAFIGSGGAGILISSLSIVADFIGKNKECSAFIYGIMSLVDKVSNGNID